MNIADFDSLLAFVRSGDQAGIEALRASLGDETQFLELLKYKSYKLFRAASKAKQSRILAYLKQVLSPEQFLEMLASKDYAVINRAITAGDSESLRLLLADNPAIDFISIETNLFADDAELLIRAAGDKHFQVIMQFLDCCTEEGIEAALTAEHFMLFRRAAEYGAMDFIEFCLANLALETIEEMLRYRGYKVLRDSVESVEKEVFRYLIQQPSLLRDIEANPIYNDLAAQALPLIWQQLQERMPAGNFEFSEEDLELGWDQLTYFLIRFWIRNADSSTEAQILADIERLMTIPSVKHLVEISATQVALDNHRFFAARPNELLELATQQAVCSIQEYLRSIVAIRQAEADRVVMEPANALGLLEQAQDPESSMQHLNQAEKIQGRELERCYSKRLKDLGVDAVIEHLRAALRAYYLAETVSRTWRYQGQQYLLPMDYAEFRAFSQDLGLKEEAIRSANQVYFQNPFHTLWRYLAKPNPWIHPRAAFAIRDPLSGGRYADFEPYQSLIALFWLAAGDTAYPPPEGMGTVEDRKILFIKELAPINRAHNQQQGLKKMRPSLRKRLALIDPNLDKPSCDPGTKRRIFQSLFNHPRFQPLNIEILQQFCHEWIYAYYQETFQRLSLVQLKQLAALIASVIDDLQRPDTKQMQWLNLDYQSLREALLAQYEDQAALYIPDLERFLDPGSLGHPLLAQWQAAGLDRLLALLIEEKDNSSLSDSGLSVFTSQASAAVSPPSPIIKPKT